MECRSYGAFLEALRAGNPQVLAMLAFMHGARPGGGHGGRWEDLLLQIHADPLPRWVQVLVQDSFGL